MAGFTKLFSSIVDSTIWREEMHIKVVWVTMLAKAYRNGFISSSLPGLADAARVTIPQCEDALRVLTSPDPYSRTKDFDGRRAMVTDGGWILLNYLKYRKVQDEDEVRIATAERVRKHREKYSVTNVTNVTNVTDVTPSNAIAEGEAEAEATTTKVADAPAVAAKPPRKRNKNFEIAAANLPDDVAEAFARCWRGWPEKGYNFKEKSNQPRRINQAKACENFYLVCQNLNLATEDGTPIGPAMITDAALAWVERLKQKTFKQYGYDIAPPVPCIANFFSADPASKKHWQEAIIEQFGAEP